MSSLRTSGAACGLLALTLSMTTPAHADRSTGSAALGVPAGHGPITPVELCGGLSRPTGFRVDGNQGLPPISLSINQRSIVELDFTPSESTPATQAMVIADTPIADVVLGVRNLGPLTAGVPVTYRQGFMVVGMVPNQQIKLRVQVINPANRALEVCAGVLANIHT